MAFRQRRVALARGRGFMSKQRRKVPPYKQLSIQQLARLHSGRNEMRGNACYESVQSDPDRPHGWLHIVLLPQAVGAHVTPGPPATKQLEPPESPHLEVPHAFVL